MAAFKLPRLKANLPIVNSNGNPLDYFLRFWNIEVAPRIERQEADQQEILDALQAQQAEIQAVQQQQAAQLSLINSALELAGLALSQTGNGGTASLSVDIDSSTWQNGPEVNLTGVVAGDLSFIGSTLLIDEESQIGLGTVNGSLRFVEVIGGIDDVVLGPYAFTINNGYFSCPSLSSAETSRTTTGDMSYRVDYIYNSGATALDVDLVLVARRSV